MNNTELVARAVGYFCYVAGFESADKVVKIACFDGSLEDEGVPVITGRRKIDHDKLIFFGIRA